MADPRDGFIFATTGEKYTGLARRAARNLRQVMPQTQIDLFTDQPVSDTTFDQIHPVTPGFFRPKMEALANSRFDRTVYLDADVVALSDVSDLFDVMDRHDIAGAHMQFRNTALAVSDHSLPAAFPQINGGVLAVKKGPGALAFLQRWEQVVRDTNATFDQPALRQLLWQSDLRLAVLPMEYNFKCMTFTEVLDSFHSAPKLMHVSELNATEKWREEGPYTLDELVGARRADHIRALQAVALQPEDGPTLVPPLFRRIYTLAYPQHYLKRYGKGRLQRLLQRLHGGGKPVAAKDPEAK